MDQELLGAEAPNVIELPINNTAILIILPAYPIYVYVYVSRAFLLVYKLYLLYSSLK